MDGRDDPGVTVLHLAAWCIAGAIGWAIMIGVGWMAAGVLVDLLR